jgi:hypothetical protein
MENGQIYILYGIKFHNLKKKDWAFQKKMMALSSYFSMNFGNILVISLSLRSMMMLPMSINLIQTLRSKAVTLMFVSTNKEPIPSKSIRLLKDLFTKTVKDLIDILRRL